METTVDEPSWLRTSSWAGCPLIGGALGLGVWAVADWAANLKVSFPFKAVFTFLTALPRPWGTAVAIVAGAVLGLAFATAWARGRLIVTVGERRITLVRGDKTRRIEAELAAVYLDGKELVLSTTDGRELVREKTDLEAEQLAKAFTEHGHPWLDEPPPER